MLCGLYWYACGWASRFAELLIWWPLYGLLFRLLLNFSCSVLLWFGLLFWLWAFIVMWLFADWLGWCTGLDGGLFILVVWLVCLCCVSLRAMAGG